MMNDGGPEDWEEIEEENAPENLKRKWIEREHFQKKPVACPLCGKSAASDSLTCLFCGAYVFEDTGLLGKLLKWFKKMFR
jgi:hypothetical protein